MNKVLLIGADGIDHGNNFIITQVGTLATQERTGTRPQEEHVAIAKQFFRTHFIEDNATVRATGHLE